MNLQSHLFASFFQRQPLAARLNWMGWGAAQATAIIGLTFFEVTAATIEGPGVALLFVLLEMAWLHAKEKQQRVNPLA